MLNRYTMYLNIEYYSSVYFTGTKLKPNLMKTTKSRSSHSLGHIDSKESDFFVLQATLQTEARVALAQAKEKARLQMEVKFQVPCDDNFFNLNF